MASQFKTFTAGATLTASEVNNYLMKQAVIVCDAAVDYPSSPTEGMVVYDKALDCYLAYTGSGWVRTLSIGNAGAQTWTPTISQPGALTTTGVTAYYVRRGLMVDAWATLQITLAGTTANAITTSLPVNASTNHSVNDSIGSGMVYDTGTANYSVDVQLNGVRTQAIFPSDGGNSLGSGPAMALASGDFIRFHLTYMGV